MPIEAPRVLDRNLALEAIRVTEGAALAASRFMGRGCERTADEAAIAAMHAALSGLDVAGNVVIGDGPPGNADRLYVGERLGGSGGPGIDVAANPLEGPTIVAKGGNNALSVLALGEPGAFLPVPGVYMQKIAVGPDVPGGVVSLDAGPADNLRALADARGADPEDILVCILDRPRHERIIEEIRDTGGRIMLIADGDVSGVVAAAQPDTGIDMYLGTGGAPEGVLAAAALRGVGGHMEARLAPFSHDDRAEIADYGIDEPDRLHTAETLAAGEVMFACTGVTDSALLRGVRRRHEIARTHTLVTRSKSGTVRTIEARHSLEQGP